MAQSSTSISGSSGFSPRNTRISPPQGDAAGSFRRGREAAALLLVAGAVFVALALMSFAADPATPELQGANWVGPVGAGIAHFLVGAIGVVAWSVPAELVLMALPLLLERPNMGNLARLGGDLIVIFIVSALIHVAFPTSTAFGAMTLSGDVGDLFGELMISLFSTVGSFLVGSTAIALVLITRASFSFISVARRAGWTTEHAAKKGVGGFRYLAEAWRRARLLERRRSQTAEPSPIPVDMSGRQEAILPNLDDDLADAAEQAAARFDLNIEPVHVVDDTDTSKDELAAQDSAVESAEDDDTWDDLEQSNLSQEPVASPAVPPAKPKKRRRTRHVRNRAASPADHADAQLTPEPTHVSHDEPLWDESEQPPSVQVSNHQADSVQEETVDEPVSEQQDQPAVVVDDAEMDASFDKHPTTTPEPSTPRKKGPRPSEHVPRIVDTSASRRLERGKSTAEQPTISPSGFRLPSVELLTAGPPVAAGVTEELEAQLNENAEALVTALKNYGVQGEVREILPGPTVTTFELRPAPGTKVSKIAGLADDLAMNLGRKVRIIAPIPGKKRVGFEVPNKSRSTVSLRELVEDSRFQGLDTPLPVVLGRDIVGAPFFADLSSMPHLLVAGATGAGKSVGLNVMLVSLLYRKTPEQLRLLMIDPKVVELQSFDGLPHMLLPVVTDTKKAAIALKWAVDEMERRYQLLADSGTKNIKTYNAWVQRVLDGDVPGYGEPKPVISETSNGTTIELGPEHEPAPLPEKLPYILLVIDEFADLMMQQGKEVEASIARLAQKARAAGMHIILATQRPSVDVITGMIKANFPTRIAFKVTQRIDSRTILDEQGAEHLLGRGDMLVKLNGRNDTMRVQCPFVSEEEVDEVTSFLRKQGKPEYNEAILEAGNDEASKEDSDAEDDPKYDEALRIVAETQRCSTSWLQRKLGIGYNRAARIVEVMEARGVVGPAIGAKNREVLVEPH